MGVLDENWVESIEEYGIIFLIMSFSTTCYFCNNLEHLAITVQQTTMPKCRVQHYYWLDSSSHRTTCGITAGLSDLYTAHHWAVAALMSSYIFIVANFATSTLLWDYAAMKAVWDHTRSFLRHHCRLWLRHHADFTCSITANLIRCLIGQLAASLPTWVIFILLIIEQLQL
jgi:hypothetical protein